MVDTATALTGKPQEARRPRQNRASPGARLTRRTLHRGLGAVHIESCLMVKKTRLPARYEQLAKVVDTMNCGLVGSVSMSARCSRRSKPD